MDKRHYLALDDGGIFYGRSCGAPRDSVGEAVFNTGMTGYQEIISDPSYAGQFVTLSTAEVGNYGCNHEDMESRGLFLNGLIVQTMNEPSNYRSEESLSAMLRRHDKPALCDVDTRRLVLHIREHGTRKAYMHVADEPLDTVEAIARAQAWEGLDGQDYVAKVSNPSAYDWNRSGDLRVVAFDFGIKYNILRSLAAVGIQVQVVPAWTTAGEVLARKPDGVFLSNGPADPSALTGAIAAARQLVGRVPVMGICLGHQILCLAMGASCGRLKFGHHGCNHPVRNLERATVEITSQNHNYAVAMDSLPDCLDVTHINLNDQTLEGVRHKHEPMFCVQYHPEAGPGPNDALYLFKQFRELMGR